MITRWQSISSPTFPEPMILVTIHSPKNVSILSRLYLLLTPILMVAARPRSRDTMKSVEAAIPRLNRYVLSAEGIGTGKNTTALVAGKQRLLWAHTARSWAFWPVYSIRTLRLWNQDVVRGRGTTSDINSGHRIEDHFVDVTEMIEIGKQSRNWKSNSVASGRTFSRPRTRSWRSATP